MNICYFDQPHTTDKTATHLAAEIARYLQARQHLGKTVVVCEKPIILLALTRKHWLKRVRALQKERAGTINAEKILRLSSTITHMHRMDFSSRPPEADPRAHVFFVTPSEITILPINTYSLYLTTPLTALQLDSIVPQLPADALVTDFCQNITAQTTPLQPKAKLEAHIIAHWQQMLDFLTMRGISADTLATTGPQQFTALDDALDILLGTSQQFLQISSELQHARPRASPATGPDQSATAPIRCTDFAGSSCAGA